MSPVGPPIDLASLPLPRVFEALTSDGLTRRLLEIARDEDLGPRGLASGDVTSAAVDRPDEPIIADLTARAPGVVAGLAAVPMLLDVFAAPLAWEPAADDGSRAEPGRRLGTLRGPARALLGVERTLLNLVCRLSGVATLTALYVEAVAGTRARVCDTRKTTPGMRGLEKYAVRCGGGTPHRVALHDAALFKDNHLARVPLERLAAWAADAAARARAAAGPHGLRFVEVEADTLEQFRELLRTPAQGPGRVDIVLLDNMPPDALRAAADLRDAQRPDLLLEASGGVRLATVRDIARSGVDRVSVGEITHSAPALDLALDAR